MIAAWMLYAAALAALLGVAALTLDHALRLAGRPARAVWMLAIAGSLLAPAAAWIAEDRAVAVAPTMPQSAPAANAAADDRLLALLANARTRVLAGAEADVVLRSLDRPLLALWLVASIAMLGGLLRSHARLRRTAAGWRRTLVEGEPVLVSPSVGPAVVGLTGGEIVLPTWALALDERRLNLMLAHEREHVRARDPLLLGGAALAAVLMPWNPTLWWQLHRLRLSVEMDCDQRVLRRHPDVGGYGRLLLDVAQGDVLGARLPVTALASPVTSLERRIRTMTMHRPRHVAVRALGLAAITACLVVIACETPRPPTAPVPRSNVAVTEITGASESAAPGEKGTVEMVRAALAKHLPEVATSATGHAQRVWVVVDAKGMIVQAVHDESSADKPVTVSGKSTIVSTRPPRTTLTLRAEGSPTVQGSPPALDSVNTEDIASVDVFKLAPGAVAPDAVGVVWIQLRAPGDAAKPSPRAAVASRSQATTPATARTWVALREPIVAGSRSGEQRSVRDERPLSTATASGITPLYIVDGREVTKDVVDQQLQPSDIASVEVVKGAAAEQIYGERAKGGVIRITTKAAPRTGTP